jgi:wyosine [tRNA(Phe)-imidazoG37] synthetase (radical SAM superfamily)
MSGEARQPLFVHRDHRRTFAENRYVYAVISRRSKGVSIGVNLNPDKVCNFDCVYCQVDRSTPGPTDVVELRRLEEELDAMLASVTSGELYEIERFRSTPAPLRRLNDIAFSGDGEPTTCLHFPEVVRLADRLRTHHGLPEVKLVLISNATRFHAPQVRDTLEFLAAHHGEVWAKLDAGTEAYYHTIERTTIPLSRILDNIAIAGRIAPVVIQSLFLKLHGEPPSDAEIDAYIGRLEEIVRAGAKIALVQVYTVARVPAEQYVTALTPAEVDAIVARVKKRTGLAAEGYY